MCDFLILLQSFALLFAQTVIAFISDEFSFLVLWSETNVASLALCWMTLGGAWRWWECRWNAATANDLFHIMRCLLHFESLTCMWNDQSKGQFLQEFLSLLFFTFSTVGHIFWENNKCIQGNVLNYSIKKPHWPTVCFSCRGVQAANLIMTVHTTFFLVVRYVYFFFSSILVSLFFRMHSGQEDDPLVFLKTYSNHSL